MVPPARRNPKDITWPKECLEAAAHEFRKTRESLQVGGLEVYAALPVLRMVNWPRVEAAEMARVEEEHPLPSTELRKDIVLRVVVAWREAAWKAAEELAHLRLTSTHHLRKPVPTELLHVSRHSDATTLSKAAHWTRSTGLCHPTMQQSRLEVEAILSLGCPFGGQARAQICCLPSEVREAHLHALICRRDPMATRVLPLREVVVAEATPARGWCPQDEEVVNVSKVTVQVVKTPELRGLSSQIAPLDDNWDLAPQEASELRVLGIQAQHLAAKQPCVVAARRLFATSHFA
mmetsp:Transcript_24179/g.53632  ORF Transcript_24179/g.53632 Transcript_24179/m.53632 type:complete len:291 (+) Transcript_24179:518-1390(+)